MTTTAVYWGRLKDDEGFPTVAVAGPDREHVWLYGHGPSVPTVLRLHRPVVRFLVDAFADVADWFAQPRKRRGTVIWTLPGAERYPECVLIASDARAWLHVYAMTPTVLRLNEGTVAFLREAVANLPSTEINQAGRALCELDLVPPAALITVTPLRSLLADREPQLQPTAGSA